MSLAPYHKKRNFSRTAEPRGKVHRGKSLQRQFVVQKHAASHLHYDFRLEHEGVLKSWAVPKGPSLDPAVKRLAMEVEDHPLEYGEFEGTIPAGDYGGGTVMLWDRGVWEPIGNAAAGYRAGKLKFYLHGEKLTGEWVLVRRGGSQTTKPQWLLFKAKDESASKDDITETAPLSVKTGRDLDEIASGKSAVWKSDRSKNAAADRAGILANKKSGKANRSASTNRSKSAKAASKKASGKKTSRKKSGSKTRLPSKIDLQLPTLVSDAPDGDDWLHEVKFDGYRVACRIDQGEVSFITRNHLDWTAKIPELAATVEKLGFEQTVLDGEIVAFDKQGLSNFQSLQNAFREGRTATLVFAVFDILFHNGEDLRKLPLEERKERLAELGLSPTRGSVRLVEHLVGDGPAFFEGAKKQGLEGIISKRLGTPYTSGRSTDWLKIKAQQNAEFVIGGYTDPAGSRRGFGALLLGYYDSEKQFHYAGRVGTGFNDALLAEMHDDLSELETDDSPFSDYPPSRGRVKGVHWVAPKRVAEISFTNWTDDRMLRHPVFLGLREDKPAKTVTREMPKATDEVTPAPRGSKGAKVKIARTSAAAKTKKARATAAKSVAKAVKSATAKPAGKKHGADPDAEVAGVRLSHPSKLLWPDDGLTKRDLAEHYAAVAEAMLPYVADRPLSIVRCPDGINGERFFQKHPGHLAPEELGQVSIKEKRTTEQYFYIKDEQSLVALAQIGAVEIHVWGSRVDRVEQPDQVIFDLDPAPDVPWRQVVDSAFEIRDFLAELGLTSFAKTSGGKGFHVACPIQRKHDWEYVSDFCQRVARAIERAAPDRYISVMTKAKRVGKVFVDYLRNQRGATSIGLFSTRARPGAPISVPVSWDELRRIKGGDHFTTANIGRRLKSQKHDPWAEWSSTKQSLTAAMLKKLS